jgi:hypothetical protein
MALCALTALHILSTSAGPTTAPAFLLRSHPAHGSASRAAGDLIDYLPGTVWVPDRFSLGPAPAALAGAESVLFIMSALADTALVVSKGDMLVCLRLTKVMTKLGRAMITEAAGKYMLRVCLGFRYTCSITQHVLFSKRQRMKSAYRACQSLPMHLAPLVDADPSFPKSFQTREVQRSWIATCAAMCKVAAIFFALD